MEMIDYFLKYQAKVGLVCIAALAVFLPIYLAGKDKKDRRNNAQESQTEATEAPNADCPGIYAILPVIPLLLVVACGDFDRQRKRLLVCVWSFSAWNLR